MRRLSLAAVAAVVSSAVAVAGAEATVPTTAPTVSFTCQNGAEQLYLVPANVDRLAVAAGGGVGGTGESGTFGGHGESATATIMVTPGQTLAINVGCAGGVGTGGAGWAHGGKGGSSSLYESGGGGGGATGISVVTGVRSRRAELVLGGGGGSGGGAGLTSGDVGAGGVHNPYKGSGGQTTYVGSDGWRSRGGGGGGGGAGGWRGGNGGRGGSYFGDEGARGWGGSSYAAGNVINVTWSDGGAPASDGYVVIVPVSPGRVVPTVATFGCTGSYTQVPWTVPGNVHTVLITASGASGAEADGSHGGGGGLGGRVRAQFAVTPGQSLGVVAGCTGQTYTSDGTAPGWGSGGDGGTTDDGYVGWGGGAGGGGSAVIAGSTPLVVAGAGGGGGGDGLSGSGGGGGNGGAQPGNGYPGTRSGSGGGGAFAGSTTRNGANGSNSKCAGAGGGGGGGYNGGGKGNAGSCSRAGGGGGGGSSYASTQAVPGSVIFTDGVQNGNGVVTIVATASTAPDAPTNVQATPGNGQATVTFTPGDYDGGNGAVSYLVRRFPGGAVVASGSGTSDVITGLNNGSSYSFTVEADNETGDSPQSALSNPVVPVGPPSAPSNVTVVAGVSSASVSFAAPFNGGSPLTQYTATVYPPSGAPFTFVGTTSPISLTGLANGAAYSVTVSASNALYDGPPSTGVGFTPRTTPDAPTSVSATPGDQQAVVSFTGPAFNGGSPVTGYTVTSSPAGITASGTASPITVTGLTDGTSYTFTVTAVNAVGTGATSDPSAAVIPSEIPAPPVLVSAQPGDGRAVVSFHVPLDDGGAPVTSYTVTASNGATATGNASPITVGGLTNGTPYTFTVTATNDVGTSQPSPASAAVTPTAGLITGVPNDDFANAQVIGGSTGTVTGNNTGATLQPGEPAASFYQTSGASIWYKWTIPTGGGAVQFDLCGSGLTGTLGAFQDQIGGGNLADLTALTPGRLMVHCPDGVTSAPAIVFDLNQSGGTYYIDVAGTDTGSGPSQGPVQLNWQPSSAGG